MNLSKSIVLSLALMMLSACGGDSSSDSNSSDQDSELFAIQASSAIKDPNSIYGLWESGTIKHKSHDSIARVRIEDGIMTAANKCVFDDGVTLIAESATQIRIQDQKIIILVEEEEFVKSDDGVYGCKISFDKKDPSQVEPFQIEDGILSSESLSTDELILHKIGN